MKWIQGWGFFLCVTRKYLYMRANAVHGQLQYSKELTTLFWAILVHMCMPFMTPFSAIYSSRICSSSLCQITTWESCSVSKCF